jgi:GNAT superfamily N-acetyltransferase
MNAHRRTMALSTASFAAEEARPPRARALGSADAAALARLMFDAYKGTIDDEGEPFEGAVAEVNKTFEGGYGPMVWGASFVTPSVEDPAVLDSASVVTLWREEPLLAFSMTRPEAKRRGHAEALIRASARSLAGLGHGRVVLVVTAGNVAAERLYEKLGFQDIPRP